MTSGDLGIRRPPRRWALAPTALRLAPHLLIGALAAGLLSSLVLRPPAAAAAVAVVSCAIGAAFAVAASRSRAALACLGLALALAGVVWGGWRIAETSAPDLDLPRPVSGVVVIDTPPVPDGRGGLRARAVAESLASARARVPKGTRLLLRLPPGAVAPAVGARLEISGRLQAAAASTSPDWWRTYLARQGIAAALAASRVVPIGRRGGPAGLRDSLRRWAAAGAAVGLRGDRRALVRGMALGGGAGLSEDAAQAFRDAGIWHLLAVSGQNVAVVALAALLGLRAIGVARRPATVAAGALLVAYCLACDGGASVARAGAVGALALIAELRSTERQRWYTLLVGLAAILAVQPRAIGDPGLQLSFSAVAGIFLLAPALADRARGWMPGRVADLAGLALAAGLATAPVLVWHFGRLSLVGLVVNVVAVPLAAPIVVLALAGIGAGALVPVAGVAFAWLAGLGAALLLLVARAAAAVPGAAVDLPRAATVPLVAVAVLIPLAGLLRRRPLDDRGTGGHRRRVLAVCVTGAAVLVAVVVWWPRVSPVGPWPSVATITALDIGQGDAILLRSPDGGAALIDAGSSGSPAPVLAALRRAGVRRLTMVAMTHAQEDHAGGLVEVIETMPVGLVIQPPLPDATDLADRIARAARRRGVPLREVRAGEGLRVGAWRLAVLSPTRRPAPGVDPNAGSLVVLASAGDLDALLTGDAESEALAGLSLPPVEILKVAHHGSADPGLSALLARTVPRVGLISCGAGNRFGHPDPGTADALAEAGVEVWRTDRSGDLEARAAGVGVAVRPTR